MLTNVNMELTIIFYVFLMQGEGWQFWSNYDSNFNDVKTNSPNSYILYYFQSTLTLGIIAFVQYLLKQGLRFVFPLPYETFVDLCCIANTSVFIFDADLHGYYIHGENPSGQADVSAK
jgi:meckelin